MLKPVFWSVLARDWQVPPSSALLRVRPVWLLDPVVRISQRYSGRICADARTVWPEADGHLGKRGESLLQTRQEAFPATQGHWGRCCDWDSSTRGYRTTQEDTGGHRLHWSHNPKVGLARGCPKYRSDRVHRLSNGASVLARNTLESSSKYRGGFACSLLVEPAIWPIVTGLPGCPRDRSQRGGQGFKSPQLHEQNPRSGHQGFLYAQPQRSPIHNSPDKTKDGPDQESLHLRRWLFRRFGPLRWLLISRVGRWRF